MQTLYFWLYILVMSFVWWIFIIAKIHFFKFKNYSKYIYPVTKLLLFSLIFLTLIWFYFVSNIWSWTTNTETISETISNEVY